MKEAAEDLLGVRKRAVGDERSPFCCERRCGLDRLELRAADDAVVAADATYSPIGSRARQAASAEYVPGWS